VHIPPIPELEVLAVQIFLFLMLIFALAGLLVREWYRLKRNWIEERRRIAFTRPSPHPSQRETLP
jgi:hypothetical protein